MTKLDGKKISEKILNEIEEEIKKRDWKNKIGLAVIIIGERKDSCVYVRKKIEACGRVGIKSYKIELKQTATNEMVCKEIEELNKNDNIHGILIQLPIPNHLNEEKILRKINYLKDVDGFHANNIGYLAMERREPLFIPCTPLGCFELLKEYNIEIEGKEVVVIGKSNIVGLPMALIMMKEMATVTVCHIKTKNIEEHTKRADILIVGVGKGHMVKKDWVKGGVVVIDIGINVLKDETRRRGYRLIGDVDYENVKEVASYITPVPGGVGPMTVSMLIKNTLKSYKNLKGY
jgi:5,10-methylene-tetrahydrofolate dehydrogenase/methenyl tetrahydrofolate cyclohydrolase